MFSEPEAISVFSELIVIKDIRTEVIYWDSFVKHNKNLIILMVFVIHPENYKSLRWISGGYPPDERVVTRLSERAKNFSPIN